MKILVYGAGNIGSLYAAKLKVAGYDGQHPCQRIAFTRNP